MTGGYQPKWDVDKADGEKAERLYMALRNGILVGSTEVKRDRKAHLTGNFYIELSCRRVDGWHDSGLRATEAAAWAFVSWPIVIAVPTWILRRVVEECDDAHDTGCAVGSHPTRGVVIPMGRLLECAVAVANTPIERKAA